MSSAPNLVYDIEVAGLPWEEVDEITRGYLMNKQRDDAARESVRERTALFPGLGKVIAIGMWLVDEERGMLLLEGDEEPEQVWEKVSHSKIERGSEAQILRRFWELVDPSGKGKRTRLVTFNGRGYDGPVLMTRSAQLSLLAVGPALHDLGDRARFAGLRPGAFSTLGS